jgi:hypothetical protein
MADLLSEDIAKLAIGALPGNCEILHGGNCIKYWIENFWHGFKFGMKFYFPLHFMPLILKYKQLLKKPFETIKNALKGCVRSTMVLAVMVLIAKISVCGYAKATKKLDITLLSISSVTVPLASFIETPARISEMAMYVMPRFFDAVWKFFIRRKLVINIPYAKVLLFCLSTSIILYSHNIEPDNIKPMYRTVCDKFFGKN